MKPPSMLDLRKIFREEKDAKAIYDMIDALRWGDHDGIDSVLDKANGLMDKYPPWSFGVEAIIGPWVDGYYCDINMMYVNTGDAYYETLMYDTVEDEWLVSSWGDIVENDPRFREVDDE